MRKNRPDTAGMTKTALCTALLCVSSYLVIPLPFTPVVLSLHTVVVNLIGLILKPRQAAGTLLLYLAMGLIGLPVFSGGTGGPGKLFGPTGGYYFGFLAAVILMSLLVQKKSGFGRNLLVTICVGLPVQHLAAILFMCFHNGFNLAAAAVTVSLPFIPGDVLKCLAASVVGTALNRVLARSSATI